MAVPERVIPAEKTCTRCRKTKASSEFGPSARAKDGLHSWCRRCVADKASEYRQRDPEKHKASLRASYAKNREAILEQLRQKRLSDLETVRAKDRRKRIGNPAYVTRESERKKRWRLENPGRHQQQRAAHAAANPEKHREWSRTKYLKKRQDPAWVMKRRVAIALWRQLGGKQAASHWFDLLGYSPDDLRAHLERQFVKGMGWHNMGKWHIDHIIPMASFTITGPDDPEFKRAWALPNLRPLWAVDNMRKCARVETLL